MEYQKKFLRWLNADIDEATKKELYDIRNDEEEIKMRFMHELSFGTAGLRSIMGAGTNRMNIYTVRKATQGLANFINDNKQGESGMVIAYDSRRNSDIFARETAACFAANGIQTYLFSDIRSVPELSFAVREKKRVRRDRDHGQP